MKEGQPVFERAVLLGAESGDVRLDIGRQTVQVHAPSRGCRRLLCIKVHRAYKLAEEAAGRGDRPYSKQRLNDGVSARCARDEAALPKVETKGAGPCARTRLWGSNEGARAGKAWRRRARLLRRRRKRTPRPHILADSFDGHTQFTAVLQAQDLYRLMAPVRGGETSQEAGEEAFKYSTTDSVCCVALR